MILERDNFHIISSYQRHTSVTLNVEIRLKLKFLKKINVDFIE